MEGGQSSMRSCALVARRFRGLTALKSLAPLPFPCPSSALRSPLPARGALQANMGPVAGRRQVLAPESLRSTLGGAAVGIVDDTYTIHPTPYTLHPPPCALGPTP